MLYFSHMSDRKPSNVERYRTALVESRGSEREMRELADGYLALRVKGELLIASALDRVRMSPEDKRTLLSSEFALITADAERAIDGDKEAEDRIEVAMNRFLSHLAGRRGEEMVADAYGQVEAALELLAEIRTARRGMIEALRDEISKSCDVEAAKECCRLLEEEIAAARASMDIESERIAAASLDVVRRLAVPEEVDQEEEDLATTLAQALITRNEIAFADSKWAVNTLRRYLAASNADDKEGYALQETIKEYRLRNAAKPRDTRDIDPHAHLVGAAH